MNIVLYSASWGGGGGGGGGRVGNILTGYIHRGS